MFIQSFKYMALHFSDSTFTPPSPRQFIEPGVNFLSLIRIVWSSIQEEEKQSRIEFSVFLFSKIINNIKMFNAFTCIRRFGVMKAIFNLYFPLYSNQVVIKLRISIQIYVRIGTGHSHFKSHINFEFDAHRYFGAYCTLWNLK